jgi:hypothetical protein
MKTLAGQPIHLLVCFEHDGGYDSVPLLKDGLEPQGPLVGWGMGGSRGWP